MIMSDFVRLLAAARYIIMYVRLYLVGQRWKFLRIGKTPTLYRRAKHSAACNSIDKGVALLLKLPLLFDFRTIANGEEKYRDFRSK